MVGPVFGGIGGRLNRQATPVASVADIRRAITKALHDDRPCVLTMSADIPMTSTLTLPGGLRAFSIDGGGRWSFILSGTIATAFNVLGAEGDNGFPVEFTNLGLKLKAGANITTMFALAQYYAPAAIKALQGTTLQGVNINTSAASCTLNQLFAHGTYTAGGDRYATFDLDNVSVDGDGIAGLMSSTDILAIWENCRISRVVVKRQVAGPVAWIIGAPVAPAFKGHVEVLSGLLDMNITTGSVMSLQDSPVYNYQNTGSGRCTLLRVATTLGRTLGANDVDLDALSQSTIASVTLNSAAPTLTPGTASYMRVTHGASASGIVTVSGTGAIDGRPVILRFVTVAGTAVYTDGSGNLRLTANFTPTSDDTLTIAYDSTTGLWYEVARSVN